MEKSALRLWKKLPPEDRLAAARAYWAAPAEDVLARAIDSIAKARRMRPQAVRSLSDEERAGALGRILDPGEPLAASLLVSLHLGERRPLLGAFLDALGLPHEDGVLNDEEDAKPVAIEDARRALERIRGDHPPGQVAVYLNTLWLQDPERWAALAELELTPPGSPSPAPGS